MRVPRQLLGDEPAHAAGREELRQRRRIAEHVGDPDLACTGVRTATRSSAGRARSGGRGSRRDGRFMSASTHMPPTGIHCPPCDLDVDALRTGRVRRSLDPRVLLGLRAGEPVVRVRRPSAALPRRTCGCTCAPSRGSATARRCRCGRGRWRRCDGRDGAGGRAQRRSQSRPGAGDVGVARRARAPTSAAAVGGVDRRGPACASARRAPRCRTPALPPRCRSAPGRRGGSGRADARRRSRASRAATGRTAGTTGSMPLRRSIVTGPGVASTAYRVRRGWMPCTGRPSIVDDQCPRTGSPGGSARNPRSMIASTRCPDHSSGTAPLSTNQVVPHGGPHSLPTTNGDCCSRVGPAVTVSGTALRSTPGNTRSCSSRVIRSSINARSECTCATVRDDQGRADDAGRGGRSSRRRRRRARRSARACGARARRLV